jgi:hypothetical protein
VERSRGAPTGGYVGVFRLGEVNVLRIRDTTKRSEQIVRLRTIFVDVFSGSALLQIVGLRFEAIGVALSARF